MVTIVVHLAKKQESASVESAATAIYAFGVASLGAMRRQRDPEDDGTLHSKKRNLSSDRKLP